MRFNIYAIIGLLLYGTSLCAQQLEVEHNSSSSNPQLTLKETESDDFVRLWFQNNNADKWAFAAKPNAGSFDSDNILSSPIIFAYNGVQKIGIGANGKVRINKAYTLPSSDGLNGQVLMTNGAGVINWETPTGGAGSSLWMSGNNNTISYDLGSVGIGLNDPVVKLQVDGAINVGYEDPSTPVAGTIRWNPNTNDFEGYDGSQWRSFMNCSVTGTMNTTPNTSPICCQTDHIASDIATQGDFNRFGNDVDIYGNFAVVGALNDAYLFEYDGTSWTEILDTDGFDPVNHTGFGEAVAIHEDWIAIGTKSFINSNGEAYMYKNTNGNWAEHSILYPDDLTSTNSFGEHIKIFGDYMAVSAYREDVENNGTTYTDEGVVYLYKLTNDVWEIVGNFTSDQNENYTNFGLNMSMDENRLLVSNSAGHKVHVYKRSGSAWSLETIIENPSGITTNSFGEIFTISGEWMAISDQTDQKVYLYKFEANQWTLMNTLESQTDFPSSYFGRSLEMRNDYLAIGKTVTNNGVTNSGAVEIYHYNNGWSFNRTVTPSILVTGDLFGTSYFSNHNTATATDGVNFIFGAPGKDVNGFDEAGTVTFGPID